MMGTEIELKLALGSESVDAFIRIPLIEEFSLHPPEVKDLVTQYYDTADFLLWRYNTSLRIRQDGTQYVQTLKQKGKSVNGLSKRGEWEWPLADDSLNASLITDEVPPHVRAELMDLRPVFKTVFKRFLWLLHLPKRYVEEGRTTAIVELVLDQGRIEVGKAPNVKTQQISEIELELKKGTSKNLLRLSEEIAELIPVRPSNVSKAERGYRLLGLPHADAQ